MGKECPECKLIEEEYARADSDDLTRDGLILALACERVKSRGYLLQTQQMESLQAQLDLAHKFHDVAVAERNHARHLLGEVLAVLNGDGGHAVQDLGWDGATKRGLARYHDALARAHGCVTYPCDCTYPRDGQADPNCGTCNGLGAITKKEICDNCGEQKPTSKICGHCAEDL